MGISMELTGIMELDVHGMRTEEAVDAIQKKINLAKNNIYRIRIIHGYHGGIRIKTAIREEFGYGREPKILRIAPGQNDGITELILREY